MHKYTSRYHLLIHIIIITMQSSWVAYPHVSAQSSVEGPPSGPVKTEGGSNGLLRFFSINSSALTFTTGMCFANSDVTNIIDDLCTNR